MRSPTPALVAALGLLAVVALLWTVDRPEKKSSGSKRATTAVSPSSLEGADSSTTLLGIAPLNANAFAALFESRVGETLALPLDPPLAGEVTMRHRHASGALALGLRFAEQEDTTAFFERSPSGRIEGHVLSRGSGTAYRIEPNEDAAGLQGRRIPAADLLCARLDGGQLLPGMPPEPDPHASESEGEEGGETEDSVPLLSSRPGADHIIYLNFEGETVVGTAWNNSFNDGNPIVAAPFGSAAHIPGIWASISEDYAPYQVDVTTDRSAFENAATGKRIMAIFTPTKEWYGNAGGVAYVGSFGSATNPYCWVFNLTLNGASEAGAHEIGHTVGLSHDGTFTRAYYSGHTHASGVSWAPIMGTGYNRDIVQFSRGEYPNANRKQDDLAIVSGYIPPLPDDHGATPESATTLTASGGAFSIDGVIGVELDEDLFRLESLDEGAISLAAMPAQPYRNLDLRLELLDSNLDLVAAAAPEGPFDASLSVPDLPPAVYFVKVSGSGLGDLATGYGRYGSMGRYTLEGTFPSAPRPAAPTGLSASDGSSPDEVVLAWNATPLAEGYRVYRSDTAEPGDAAFLGSSAAPSFADTEAVAGVFYHYFVSAYNDGGESDLSAGDPGHRLLLPPPTPAGISATTDSPHSIRVGWETSVRASGYRIYRNTVDDPGTAIEISATHRLYHHDTSTAPGESFYYFVRAYNASGDSPPTGGGGMNLGTKTAMPPGTPTNLLASEGLSPEHVALSWSGTALAAGYYLYRNTIESVSGAVSIAFIADATAYLDGGGIAGQSYFYFVRSLLEGGESAPSNLAEGSRALVPPPVPIDLAASRGTLAKEVLVTWAAARDASRYLVYRGPSESPDNADYLGQTDSLEWHDATVAAGRSYRYFVRAENLAGMSVFSAGALGYPGDLDPGDDAFENNDDPSTAFPLNPVGGPTITRFAARALVLDPDWYEVRSGSGPATLSVAVVPEATRGSLRLSLFDEAGSPAAFSTTRGNLHLLSLAVGSGETFRILVECDEGLNVPYRLAWGLLAPGTTGHAPDLRYGPVFPPQRGAGLVSTRGSGQILRLAVGLRKARRAFHSLENVGSAPGAFRLRGRGGNRHFSVRYRRLVGASWRNITAATVRGKTFFSIDPFATASFRIEVKARRTPRRAALMIPLRASSPGSAASDDLVRFRCTKKATPRQRR